MKCLVSVQEASSVFRFYCTEWVGGIITQWFKEEMEPELGDADTSDDEWQRKEKRECFEATRPVMSCVQCTWRICS